MSNDIRTKIIINEISCVINSQLPLIGKNFIRKQEQRAITNVNAIFMRFISSEVDLFETLTFFLIKNFFSNLKM